MKTKFFSALILASIFFVGCYVDDDNLNGPDKNYNASAFFDEFSKDSKQTFDLNTSDLPKTVTLKGGTKINIKPGTFTKGGVPITGNFTLEVKEVLKRSDIIFNGTNTNYIDGKPLLSDGFLYINAKDKDGAAVDTLLAKNLQVEIPRTRDLGTGVSTQLWEGTEEAGESKDQFAWDEFPKDGINDEERVDGENQQFAWVWSDQGSTVFSFSLGKLGWFNCDIYWTSSNGMTTVRVTITGQLGGLASYQGYTGFTFVFFCGKGDNVISQLYSPFSSTVEGALGAQSYVNSMPIGKEGKLIVFSIKEGEFTFGTKENVTITANLDLTVDLKPATKEQIQAAIEALDNFK
jgi:hypothetical protein